MYIRQDTYSRTPEIGTANLSQFHASFNLSKFWAYCLFHRISSTAAKNNRNVRLMLEINYDTYDTFIIDKKK